VARTAASGHARSALARPRRPTSASCSLSETAVDGSARRRGASRSATGCRNGQRRSSTSAPRRIYLDNLRLHVLPELGAVQLNKLDKAMLRAWLARLSAGPLKPATVHQGYRALRRVLASAVENGVIARNPLKRDQAAAR